MKSAPTPDGIKPKQWRKLAGLKKVILFNLFLFLGVVPPSVLDSRTIVVPKRPIIIGSVILRHFHHILVQRVQKAHLFDSRQRANRVMG